MQLMLDHRRATTEPFNLPSRRILSIHPLRDLPLGMVYRSTLHISKYPRPRLATKGQKDSIKPPRYLWIESRKLEASAFDYEKRFKLAIFRRVYFHGRR